MSALRNAIAKTGFAFAFSASLIVSWSVFAASLEISASKSLSGIKRRVFTKPMARRLPKEAVKKSQLKC